MRRQVWSIALLSLMLLGTNGGCDTQPTSDQRQKAQNEVLLQEATSQTGMPAIKNFRERKLLKDILELRDQDGLVTYTYLWSDMQGKLVFLGESIGYGIPYATQYTNPQRPAQNWEAPMRGNLALPQADPNGLFTPSAAEGTWVLLKNPHGKEVRPVFIEPRILVSPFRLEPTPGVAP